MAACALLCGLAAGGFSSDAPKKATKDEIKAMMTKLHKGEKSVLAQTRTELDKEGINWGTMAANAKAFTEMGELLRTGANPYTSPKNYIDGAAELATAAKEKKREAAFTAFTKLSTSCVACHYGNPAK